MRFSAINMYYYQISFLNKRFPLSFQNIILQIDKSNLILERVHQSISINTYLLIHTSLNKSKWSKSLIISIYIIYRSVLNNLRFIYEILSNSKLIWVISEQYKCTVLLVTVTAVRLTNVNKHYYFDRNWKNVCLGPIQAVSLPWRPIHSNL